MASPQAGDCEVSHVHPVHQHLFDQRGLDPHQTLFGQIWGGHDPPCCPISFLGVQTQIPSQPIGLLGVPDPPASRRDVTLLLPPLEAKPETPGQSRSSKCVCIRLTWPSEQS
eukprot:3910172-Pyramimonas_sp.AAC.1